ncbi:MAG: hypothetical protein NVS3B25_25740 [Hymenobacter sp.]
MRVIAFVPFSPVTGLPANWTGPWPLLGLWLLADTGLGNRVKNGPTPPMEKPAAA